METSTKENWVAGFVLLMLAIGFVSMVVLLTLDMKRQYEIRNEKVFKVWVKQTENPKKLTKDEFIILFNNNLINRISNK